MQGIAVIEKEDKNLLTSFIKSRFISGFFYLSFTKQQDAKAGFFGIIVKNYARRKNL